MRRLRCECALTNGGRWLALAVFLATLTIAFPRDAASSDANELVGDRAAGEGFFSEPIGTDLDVFTFVPAPASLRNAEKTATFKLNFDPATPPEARTAIQAAADIWAAVIESAVPIEVEVSWSDMAAPSSGAKPSKGILLGQARPTSFRRDFPGALQRDVWYPIALANRLTRKDLEPGKSDIVAVFNRNAPWYFGVDGATPRGKYDLVTIVLHELGHGLGFASGLKVQGKDAAWKLADNETKRSSPTIFDTFVKNSFGKRLIDPMSFPMSSEALYAELTSRKIYFAGRIASSANGGTLPSIHAPPAFKSGASFVHLSETSYPPGNVNSLMTPVTFRAEAIHHPGPVTIGMLRDMGWGHVDDVVEPE